MVYAINGSNSDLGFILGISSILGNIASLTSSKLTDWIRKDIVIFTCIFTSLIGMLLLVAADSLMDIFLGQIFISIGYGGISPAMNALFSDSVNTDDRTRIFGTHFLLSETSSAMGGVLGYFFFKNMDATVSIHLTKL